MSVPKLICIGGSSGAPMLAANLLEKLPADLGAAVMLALHMPAPLISSYGKTVAARSPLQLEIASDGAVPKVGHVYLAPGSMHIGINPQGNIVVTEKPDGTPFKPSIDILFHTAAQHYRSDLVAVVLKGLTLRRDARQGALSVKGSGGKVVVQNDPADTLFGMTRDVIDAGGATDELALADIPAFLARTVGKIE